MRSVHQQLEKLRFDLYVASWKNWKCSKFVFCSTVGENEGTASEDEKKTSDFGDLVNCGSDVSEASPIAIEKSTIFKIVTFSGTGPWELYHMQFKAATAHNQWTDVETAVILTLHQNSWD